MKELKQSLLEVDVVSEDHSVEPLNVPSDGGKC